MGEWVDVVVGAIVGLVAAATGAAAASRSDRLQAEQQRVERHQRRIEGAYLKITRAVARRDQWLGSMERILRAEPNTDENTGNPFVIDYKDVQELRGSGYSKTREMSGSSCFWSQEVADLVEAWDAARRDAEDAARDLAFALIGNGSAQPPDDLIHRLTRGLTQGVEAALAAEGVLGARIRQELQSAKE